MTMIDDVQKRKNWSGVILYTKTGCAHCTEKNSKQRKNKHVV